MRYVLSCAILLLLLVGCSSEPLPVHPTTFSVQATAFTSTLAAKHSGKCLNVKGGSSRNAARLEQRACSRSAAPTFDFVRVPGKRNTYTLRNTRTGKCLDIFRARRQNGTNLIQYRCGEGSNQHFELVRAGNGYYQLKAGHSGKCLDVFRAYKADGTRVVQYRCHRAAERLGKGNQVWKISRQDEPANPGPSVEPFSIIALPDTQNYTCCNGRYGVPATFKAQTRWIVNNLKRLSVAFVTHEGDMVDNALKDSEWRAGDEAMDVLDGKVPYAVAMGDHDYYPEEVHDGDTSRYRRYFGKSRYKRYAWYGGDSPSGLSHYQTFDGGGVTFLHIALEWEAPRSALSWAEEVIKKHPEMPTIITTHAYLRDGGSARGGRRTAQSETEACVDLPDAQACVDPGNDADAASGEKIFQTLVRPYPQVFMVLNGHYHNNGRRSSNPNVPGCDIEADDFKRNPDTYLRCDNGEYRQVSTNRAGSKVYEMLANYQDYENGGDGWLRVIKFLPGEGRGGLDRIKVQTYSPTLDTYQRGNASDFSYDLDFGERFGLGE